MATPERIREMITEVLRLVAADADTQIRSLPDFVLVPDEIALNYGDTIQLGDQVVGAGLLDQGTLERLRTIEGEFGRLSGDEAPEFWTLHAMRSDGRWEALREMARPELVRMGEELRPPALDWIDYVPGRRPRHASE